FGSSAIAGSRARILRVRRRIPSLKAPHRQERAMPEPRIAVVTGAGQGLGLETARQLAAKGYRLVLTARTQKAVAAGLEALGAETDGHVLDVSDDKTVAAFFDWLFETHGRIDVLVNNAGRLYDGYNGGLADVDTKDILEAIDNNALSALRTVSR